MFDGADQGKYPNDLPFSSADITASSVVSQVFTKNSLQTYCPFDAFRAGLVVQESSPALQFLIAEYQARLSDTRLTAVDRQRLQDEFAARRTALPREYQLTFIRPSECESLPPEVVIKVMAEVLEAWALESQERRGVLKVRAAVLSTEVFVLPNAGSITLLVRADLVRAAISRVIANIKEVEKLPGAELVGAGENRVTLAEVRVRLEDLMRARLDPLVGIAGRGLGRESMQWVTQALETQTTQLRAAETRAEAYRQALREYSGVLTTPSASSGAGVGRTQPSSDVQALTPQIDRTFIEGIVALSATNTQFRQEITRRVIDASIETASRAEVVEHYRGLLASMKDPGGTSLSPEEVARRLAVIAAEAKETTRLFNEIYAEFSRVAFRAGSALYRVEQPTQVTVLRAFRLRSYLLLLLGVSLAAPVVLALACLVLFHLRRFVKSALPA
ncbi:MAG: hypothetical protein WD690_00395 [Vicinamibacterales bacterium]